MKAYTLYWRDDKNSLFISLDVKESLEDIAAELNGDPELEKVITSALRKIYRYTSTFRIDTDVPF